MFQYTQLVVTVASDGESPRSPAPQSYLALLLKEAGAGTSARRRTRVKTKEEEKMKAAAKIQKCYRMFKLLKSLCQIKKESAAKRIQSVFRGHVVRVTEGKELEELRRQLVVGYYAKQSNVPLSGLPAAHKWHIAARRLQRMAREVAAKLRVRELRRFMAAKKIQRAYHAFKLRRYVACVEERRTFGAKRRMGATKIQAVWRGYCCRQWFKHNYEEMKKGVQESFSVKERSIRTRRLLRDQSSTQLNIEEAKAREEERKLLEMVLSVPDPNKTVIAESTRKTYLSHIMRKTTKPKTLPPLMNVRARDPGGKPVGTFVSHAQVLQPGVQTVLMTEPQPAPVAVTTLKELRAKAKAAALRRLKQIHQGLPDESATMRFVLTHKGNERQQQLQQRQDDGLDSSGSSGEYVQQGPEFP